MVLPASGNTLSYSPMTYKQYNVTVIYNDDENFTNATSDTYAFNITKAAINSISFYVKTNVSDNVTGTIVVREGQNFTVYGYIDPMWIGNVEVKGTANLRICEEGNSSKFKSSNTNINKGNYSINFNNNLAPGIYTICVYFEDGNKNYTRKDCDMNRTLIVRGNAPINVSVENITYGESFTANITLPSGVNGTVSIYLNDSFKENITITDGKGTYTIPGDLDTGDYSLKVVFDGNVVYDANETTVSFNVAKANCTFNVSVDNVTYGDNFTINVTDAVGVKGESLNGTVIVVVDGKYCTFTVTNGKGSRAGIILPAGTYSVSASFVADNYNVAENSTEFNVAKADPQVTVDIGSEKSFDIKFGDTVVAIVDVPSDATGTISFSLDNETWITKTIPKDTNLVEWDIPDLDAGNYILFVKYSGDGNYNPVYSENPFSVDQLQTTVTVDPVKGKAGEKVKITVRVTDERGNPVPEGTVIIGFNGKEYEANVVNGIATIEVVLPKAGTYSATAFYEGFNYNSSYTTFTVEVSDIPGPSPNPNPTPVNNGVGNMENTGNPLFVLLVALCAIGLESLRRKF